jgi:hypothetical protein
MSEGGQQASREIAAPAYLTSGNPGMAGGGTVTDASTRDQMTAYENIFGPAARDVKFDAQRNKRHQRWHLPDVLKGVNMFLTDRIDGLITDATNSPFTKTILPYMYVDQPDKKIKWNVYSFDEGVASRVPYEAAARVLPQSKRSFSGYAVRQGLAIAMEHNFMMSPAGMDNFRKQLQQLVGSIQMTNDLDVHMALLLAPSYQKQMDEKYYDNTVTTAQNCRMYTDLFGFMAKNENALDFLIEDAKNILQTWGSKPPTFMLCNRALTRGLTMNPEKTMYCTNGPDGKQRLAAGPDLPSYRGLSFINTRKFSLDSGTAPRDLMRRRVRVSEHYRIPWAVANVTKRYEFYDQSRDSMFYLSWYQLWEASMPSFDEPDKFLKFLGDIKHVDEGIGFYTTQLPPYSSIEDIFNGTHNPHQWAAEWTFQHFWNLGAWLGFWPACDVRVIGNRCPKFCKKDLEYVTYGDDGKVLRHWKMNIDFDNDVQQGTLMQYIHVIINFVVHTCCKNKHNLWRELDAANLNLAASPLVTDIKTDEALWDAQKTGCPDRNVVFPCDLFLLRPNIEHYMLGIIFGRGGGPEELGATFWGQTELSVYDDTQHGIWGMSYKYHERAIVTNERNLIRVFDIAFDGYCGGNDSRIMKWDEDDVRALSDATKDTTKTYAGPSMIVFALPVHDCTFDSFPNPVVIHPSVNASDATNAVPDRALKYNDINKHCCFANPQSNQCSWATEAIHIVYKLYYHTLHVEEWNHMPAMAGTAGSLSSTDETSVSLFSFSGQMAVVDAKGGREETQGSGHLGPSFVGVASVREGRGCLQTTRQAVMRNLNM